MAEEKHHHHHHHLFHHDKEEERVSATEVGYSETTAYGGGYGGGYGGVAAETAGFVESNVDYEKELKQHKRKEHLAELGAAAAGAFALHEKHKEKKDPENAHRHRIEEEIAAAVAVGGVGYAFHEHHEKKDAKKELRRRGLWEEAPPPLLINLSSISLAV